MSRSLALAESNGRLIPSFQETITLIAKVTVPFSSLPPAMEEGPLAPYPLLSNQGMDKKKCDTFTMGYYSAIKTKDI